MRPGNVRDEVLLSFHNQLTLSSAGSLELPLVCHINFCCARGGDEEVALVWNPVFYFSHVTSTFACLREAPLPRPSAMEVESARRSYGTDVTASSFPRK